MSTLMYPAAAFIFTDQTQVCTEIERGGGREGGRVGERE